MRKVFVFILLIAIALFYNAAFAIEKAESGAKEEGSERIMPKKVEADTNYDGKIDRIETYDPNGQISMIETDSDGDGIMEGHIEYENGKPVKEERDTNKDGKPDVWVNY